MGPMKMEILESSRHGLIIFWRVAGYSMTV
jgi:hypothetical protein